MAQAFVNLNFETTTITTVHFAGGDRCTATLPGWSGFGGNFINGDPNSVALNDIALDPPAVTLQGTNSPFYPAIQGEYSLLLQGGSHLAPYGSSIAQTGQVPASAMSLSFIGANWNNLQVSFNGQMLSVLTVCNASNYTVYGADISSYAGQSGELRFIAPGFFQYIDGYGWLTGRGILDRIQFSTNPVPEPSEFVLAVLGISLVSFRRLKR